jgi:para-aminobenzoate synthetase/4-amino-4-deoxychorismate lyase
VIRARFDDLRPRRRRSFQLTEPVGTIEATTTEQVVGAVAEAEAAVRSGLWVAGFVSYEAAPGFDPTLSVRSRRSDDPPLAWFGLFRGRQPVADEPIGTHALGDWTPAVGAATHAEGVDRIRELIREGDTYQVNYTFPMRATFEGDPAGLYRALSNAQNTAYGAFIETGRFSVVSASPELFFEWRHDRITSKPMKGTARRGADLGDDETQRVWLEQSEKNRAENLMIVDMVRNDLGRIARVGTVHVPALFTTEKYDTVWQLTSTVSAQPRRDTGLADVFTALFPCASITGAPKKSTMEIISELEPSSRGVYCGAIGFGGPTPDGTAHWVFNVGIRTVVIDRELGTARYGTGGGITFDSTPDDEYQEALLKAKVLARRSSDFSLLETMRWDPSAGFRHLSGHLQRLSGSAWYFDVPLDPAEVRAALERATAGRDEPLRVRLLVSRSGWVTVEAEPAPNQPPARVRLAVDTERVDASDPFLAHKTTNRLIYDEARERHPNVDDVIMVNTRDEVTETTIANLAVLVDGEWCTPPRASGCLPGVERGLAIESGRVTERIVTLEALRRSDDLARLNSVRGWEPAEICE